MASRLEEPIEVTYDSGPLAYVPLWLLREARSEIIETYLWLSVPSGAAPDTDFIASQLDVETEEVIRNMEELVLLGALEFSREETGIRVRLHTSRRQLVPA